MSWLGTAACSSHEMHWVYILPCLHGQTRMNYGEGSVAEKLLSLRTPPVDGRFSLIWAPAAEALGMALKQHQAIAWPLIFSALAQTQAELLSGHGAGQAPGTSLPLIFAMLAHHWNLAQMERSHSIHKHFHLSFIRLSHEVVACTLSFSALHQYQHRLLQLELDCSHIQPSCWLPHKPPWGCEIAGCCQTTWTQVRTTLT